MLHGISSESNEKRERKRKAERGVGEDPQLKFSNGVERNVPHKYYDFFIAPRGFIFGA